MLSIYTNIDILYLKKKLGKLIENVFSQLSYLFFGHWYDIHQQKVCTLTCTGGNASWNVYKGLIKFSTSRGGGLSEDLRYSYFSYFAKSDRVGNRGSGDPMARIMADFSYGVCIGQKRDGGLHWEIDQSFPPGVANL